MKRTLEESEMRTLVQSEDPDEIAAVIDRVLSDLGYNVLKGFNDNDGYYIHEG